MEKFVVIMAGGVGSRFWPRSRKKSPKQLLNIFGENSMIQDTVYRLDGFIKPENIYIITNKVQKALIEEQLPELNPDNIIAEPVGRNTAPCVALSSLIIGNKAPDGVIITLPADHLISDKANFTNALETASKFAYEKKALVTFGIKPTRPDTGYGYINIGENADNDVFKVDRFVEKPDLEKAQMYMESDKYLWNSGMFIWRADVVHEEIEKHLPALSEGLNGLSDTIGKDSFNNKLKEVFPGLQSISVDYGIMEKSDKVYTVIGKFDWSDVGSWETVYELSKKDSSDNAASGDVFLENTKKSYIYSPDKFTAVIGVENLVVINTKDSLLVCKRDQVQNVRSVVDHLNKENREDLV